MHGPIEKLSYGEHSFHVRSRGDIARHVDLVVVEPKPGASQKEASGTCEAKTHHPEPYSKPTPQASEALNWWASTLLELYNIKILCTLNDVWEHAANNSESLSRMTCSEQSQTRCSALVVLQRPECFRVIPDATYSGMVHIQICIFIYIHTCILFSYLYTCESTCIYIYIICLVRVPFRCNSSSSFLPEHTEATQERQALNPQAQHLAPKLGCPGTPRQPSLFHR